mmetsp:Transcript_28917/g.86083  ORF Transcript_28917/g.86083 Transcript_28917/m.86083 type:complete len:427 (-) Transcript_28917:1662-2942(-)
MALVVGVGGGSKALDHVQQHQHAGGAHRLDPRSRDGESDRDEAAQMQDEPLPAAALALGLLAREREVVMRGVVGNVEETPHALGGVETRLPARSHVRPLRVLLRLELRLLLPLAILLFVLVIATHRRQPRRVLVPPAALLAARLLVVSAVASSQLSLAPHHLLHHVAQRAEPKDGPLPAICVKQRERDALGGVERLPVHLAIHQAEQRHGRPAESRRRHRVARVSCRPAASPGDAKFAQRLDGGSAQPWVAGGESPQHRLVDRRRRRGDGRGERATREREEEPLEAQLLSEQRLGGAAAPAVEGVGTARSSDEDAATEQHRRVLPPFVLRRLASAGRRGERGQQRRGERGGQGGEPLRRPRCERRRGRERDGGDAREGCTRQRPEVATEHRRHACERVQSPLRSVPAAGRGRRGSGGGGGGGWGRQ